jgi:hypothetical protein
VITYDNGPKLSREEAKALLEALNDDPYDVEAEAVLECGDKALFRAVMALRRLAA